MRILFLGDVVGRVARQQVIAAMPDLREELAADFIIVNVENSPAALVSRRTLPMRSSPPVQMC